MHETSSLYLLPVVTVVYLLLSVLTMPMAQTECVFDKLQSSNIPSTFVQYLNPGKLSANRHRYKRDLANLYQPIRIHVEFHDLDVELAADQQENLKTVVMETIAHVTEIFKVIPVKDNLILGRTFREACKNKLIEGINAGKCYTMKGSYTGEHCLDWFKIPDSHLEGFYLYNATSPAPVKEVYASGAGVSNTDYILYVRAITSPICIEQGLSTIAYARYCQLDQRDRPIAGYINFCPVFFRDHSYNKDKARLTALHELFHALGFASDLFPKYKDCQLSDSGVLCTTRHSPVREVLGVPRLVTPCAVNLTSEHFQCRSHPTENEFGPVLQNENGKAGSHWDTAFMYGSLMTSKIGLPHLTILDPITLAVFEDSGWYKVNYDYAERFLWGKDGGCQFGLTEGCQKPGSLYYCLGSSQGCHFLHYDKAVCETDQSLHGCRVYKAKPGDTCKHQTNSTSLTEMTYTGEAYGTNSRCFVSNLTRSDKMLSVVNVPPVGRCYQTVCNDSGLYIQVHNGPYYFCPWGTTIQIPGYGGVVQCPKEQLMCLDNNVSATPEPEPTPEITERHPVNRADTRGKVCIDIQYARSTYGLVHLDSWLFQQCNLDVILKTTGVNRQRLEDYDVVEGNENRALFRFNLLPAVYSEQGPHSEEAIRLLRKAINSGNFTFIIPPNGPKYTASDMMVMDLDPEEVKNQLPNVVIAGAVVGAIGGPTVIILLILFLLRRSTYGTSNNSDINMMATVPNHSQPTPDNTQSQTLASTSQGATSCSEQRNDTLTLHLKHNSYTSPFQSPPSAQTLSTHNNCNSAQQEACVHNNCDHELSLAHITEGHINAAFQLIESPTRSAIHNDERLNITIV